MSSATAAGGETKYQVLLTAVGNVKGWNAARCPYGQISDLFIMEDCVQAVIDILVNTEVSKFPPRWMAVWSGCNGRH